MLLQISRPVQWDWHNEDSLYLMTTALKGSALILTWACVLDARATQLQQQESPLGWRPSLLAYSNNLDLQHNVPSSAPVFGGYIRGVLLLVLQAGHGPYDYANSHAELPDAQHMRQQLVSFRFLSHCY